MTGMSAQDPPGGPDRGVGELRARFAQISARLDAGTASAETLDRLKQDIIALYKTIEHRGNELTLLKEDVKRIVGKWKAVQQSIAPSIAPRISPEQPVLRADPLGASTFVDRGWSCISVGDYEGAQTALARALELTPNDPQAESLLGWALMLQERYDEALHTFQHVLVREPTNALARINLGYICLKQGLFGEAIEHLSKVIRLDNDRKATLYAHFYLGLVYFEREMYDDAQIFFLKALALGPNLIEAWYELGRARWLAGDRDGAMEAWQSGHTANRFNPWATRCATVLATVAAGGAPPVGRAVPAGARE
jgi:tetratricopeptide (TPR) repeat protein